jgi:Tfp pilus assembly pilus retraction ATPase PilT
MQTMNQSLIHLVKSGALTKADAIENSPQPEELTKLLQAIPNK